MIDDNDIEENYNIFGFSKNAKNETFLRKVILGDDLGSD